ARRRWHRPVGAERARTRLALGSTRSVKFTSQDGGRLPPLRTPTDDGEMSKRLVGWCGLLVSVFAAVALAVLFADAGLDKADKLASAVSALVGIAGLGCTLFGLFSSRWDGRQDEASRGGSGSVHNTMSGPVHGTAIQARDINLPSPPSLDRPDEPEH
ncbi:hypothetical protein ACFQ07_31590, partial [Actinomadura adrarensis]